VGRLNVRLSSKGRREARWIGRALRKRPDPVCRSSPLIRTKETAEIAFRKPGKKIRLLTDLREINFGLCEGMTFEECDEFVGAVPAVIAVAWITHAG